MKKKSIITITGYLLGIVLCFVGSVLLVYASFFLINWSISNNFTSSDSTNDYDSNDIVDTGISNPGNSEIIQQFVQDSEPELEVNVDICTKENLHKDEFDSLLTKFKLRKIKYENAKAKYFNSDGHIDSLVRLFYEWQRENLALSYIYNDIIAEFNSIVDIYSDCDFLYDLDQTISSMSDYIDDEMTLLNAEFSTNVEPVAIANGYFYPDTN